MEYELCLPPLYLRRKYLAIKYCLKSQSQSNNVTISILEKLLSFNASIYFRKKKIPLLSSVYAETKKENVSRSSPLYMFKLNTWVSKIDDDIFQTHVENVSQAKNSYDPRVLKMHSLHMINYIYNDWHKIFTDGSQTAAGRGAAYYDPSHNVKESFKIVNTSDYSIMYVELFAISAALSHATSVGAQKVVILCDSRSAIQHIARCASGYRGASIAYNILSKILSLVAEGVSLRVQWIPAHIGLRGNEEADKLAREAISDGAHIHIRPEYTEVLVKYKIKILKLWKEYFDVTSREKGIWYQTMQTEPPRVPWFANINMCRKYIVIAHRLRSGHLPLNSFKYLMRKVENPNCEVCNTKDDFYHFLTECARSVTMRENLFLNISIDPYDVGMFQSIMSAPTSDAARLLYRLADRVLRNNT